MAKDWTTEQDRVWAHSLRDRRLTARDNGEEWLLEVRTDTPYVSYGMLRITRTPDGTTTLAIAE